MLKKFCVAVLAAMLLVGGGGTTHAASAYTPEPGAAFNNPWGPRAARNSLGIKLRRTIESTPRGEVIRIAVYSFNRRDLGDALVKACHRHVSVQIVINDNWISGQVKRLRRLLGSDIDPHYDDACHPRKPPMDGEDARPPHPEPSFLKVCKGSCRDGGGNQHMKIYMFSRAGQARDVIMFGSNNMTTYAANVHWNDMFTLVGVPDMWTAYSAIYRELAQDRRIAQPYRTFADGRIVTEFGPLVGGSRAEDPIARRLAQVDCRTTAPYGRNGHSVLRITMYSWNGARGRYLAKRVAGLAREGCIVRGLLSGGGPHIRTILRQGGAVLRTPDFDTDEDEETGFGETPWEHFTHEKWMSLDGTWAGRPDRIVWTGSENWSDRSLDNDEVTVRIPRNGAYRSYGRHFGFVWDEYSRKIG